MSLFPLEELDAQGGPLCGAVLPGGGQYGNVATSLTLWSGGASASPPYFKILSIVSCSSIVVLVEKGAQSDTANVNLGYAIFLIK